MATIQDLGKVAYLNKGAYNSETTYEINDVISFNGSSYVSKINENRGNLPTNTIYWSIVASKGDKGETGKPFVIEKTYMTIEAMVADYDNMNINDYVMISGNIEEEQNATLWTKTANEVSPYKWVYLADFSGASGITGATPNIIIGNVTEGNQPAVTRRAGSSNENPILDFILKTGPKGDTGDTGNGISSIEKTGTSGLVDTYTITYTNGTTSTFQVTNGEDADITPEEFEDLQNEVDELKDENQRLKATLPTTKETGENITLDKTAEMEFVVPPLPRGNTSQNTTQGVQLLDKDTVTVINGYIVSNSDVIGDNGASNKILYITIQPNTTYTVSKNNFSLHAFGIASTVNIPAKDVPITQKAVNNSANSLTITTGANDNYLAVYCKGQSLNFPEIFYSIDLQIEEGSVASDCEVFTNGQVSPTPVYPQNINVVKGSTNVAIINKNIIKLDFINPPATIAGLNYSYTDNTLKLNGTASGTWQNFIFKNNVWFEYGKAYCFSAKVTGTNPNMQLSLIAYSSSGQALTHVAINKSNNYSSTIEFYVKEKVDHYTLSVVVTNGGEYDLTAEIMLEPGTIPTDFVEHKEQVLPLDLPVENLFDGELELGTIISGTGETGVSNNAIRSVNYIAVNPNTTYILSNNKNYTPYVFEYNSRNTYVRNSTTQVTPYTFTTTSTTKYIKFRTIESKVENDLTTKFMLELGSKANAYTPYGTTPIELCKIGDYQDYFYKDNGKWYLHKKIYKYIFTGQEDFVRVANTGNPFPYFRLYLSQPLGKASTATTILSNRYKGGTDAQLIQNDFKTISMSGNANNQLNITDDYATANDFKAFLQNNLTYVYYVLVQPTDTEITDTTLINQLEAIYNAISYEGQTNISGISGGTNPLFDVEAYQNTKLFLENLDDRLSLIEG